MAGASDSEIMREFLVSLGFKIDEAGLKKFRSGLDTTTKDALALGGAVIGVGLAIEKFVESMADSYARLYYMSERTDASVGGIKAAEAAFRGVGLSAAAADEAIESVADKLRNPGTRSQLIGLGFDVTKPTEDIANDIEKWLAKLYKNMGTRPFAISMAKQLLGLDERSFVQLVKELPTLLSQKERALDIQKQSGVNYQQLAKDSAEFNRQLGIIGQELGAIGGKWFHLNSYMLQSVETAEALAVVLDRILKGDWAHLWDPTHKGIGMAPGSDKDPRLAPAPLRKYSEQQLKSTALVEALINGLDPKLFLAQIQQESGFDPRAKSKAGAVGVAQFMPKTAEGRGFEAGIDPARDIKEMAKYMRELLTKYHDYDTALRAYNAGEGRIDRHEALTTETQEYAGRVRAIAEGVKITPQGQYGVGTFSSKDPTEKRDVTYAPTVNQTFNIQGDNADEIGRSVSDKTNRLHSDTFRDQQGILAN